MKINGHDFRIGADPEFFVARGGKVLSAHGLVPGTKENPFPVKNGAVQVDGMALEFNIDPAETYAKFEEHMSTVMSEILSMVPGYEVFADAPNPKVGTLLNPVADFDKGYMESQPKEAVELGCNPDFNAYTQAANPRPDAEVPFRTASGHIHIGWTEGVDPSDATHLEACFALVKHLDAYVGIPSFVWDQDDRRRKLYGRAGAFRPKHYGLEYRVLSNRWVASPILRKTVYHNTIAAIESCFRNPDHWEGKKVNGFTIEQIMNQEIDDKKVWEESVADAIAYFDLKTPKDYREVA